MSIIVIVFTVFADLCAASLQLLSGASLCAYWLKTPQYVLQCGGDSGGVSRGSGALVPKIATSKQHVYTPFATREGWNEAECSMSPCGRRVRIGVFARKCSPATIVRSWGSPAWDECLCIHTYL